MPVTSRWPQASISLYQRNLQGRDSLHLADISHDQTVSTSQDTARGYHLSLQSSVPHTLRGASNSKNIGCCMNIYLLLWHNPLTSLSSRLTCLGILEFLTDRSLSIMLSTLMSTFRSIQIIIIGIFMQSPHQSTTKTSFTLRKEKEKLKRICNIFLSECFWEGNYKEKKM